MWQAMPEFDVASGASALGPEVVALQPGKEHRVSRAGCQPPFRVRCEVIALMRCLCAPVSWHQSPPSFSLRKVSIAPIGREMPDHAVG
jgi:hypothetical protein